LIFKREAPGICPVWPMVNPALHLGIGDEHFVGAEMASSPLNRRVDMSVRSTATELIAVALFGKCSPQPPWQET